MTSATRRGQLSARSSLATLVLGAALATLAACSGNGTSDGDDGQRPGDLPATLQLRAVVDGSRLNDALVRAQGRSHLAVRAAEALSGMQYKVAAGAWQIGTGATVEGADMTGFAPETVGNSRLYIVKGTVSTNQVSSDTRKLMASARRYSGTVRIETDESEREGPAKFPDDATDPYTAPEQTNGAIVVGAHGTTKEGATADAITKMDAHIAAVIREAVASVASPEEVDSLARGTRDAVWPQLKTRVEVGEVEELHGYWWALARLDLNDATNRVHEHLDGWNYDVDPPERWTHYRNAFSNAAVELAPPENVPMVMEKVYRLSATAFARAKHDALRESLEAFYEVAPGELPAEASGKAWLIEFDVDSIDDEATPPSITLGYVYWIATDPKPQPAFGN